MSGFEKNHRGDWTYTDTDGDTMEVEWARSKAAEGAILIRTCYSGGGAGSSVWVEAKDVDDFIKAVQDVRQPPCETCDGTGKKKPS